MKPISCKKKSAARTGRGHSLRVANSIDRAREIPGRREEAGADESENREARLARVLALGGSGAILAGHPSAEALEQRSRAFRGYG